MSVLRRLAGLGRGGLRDLARAQVELIRAAWQIRHRPRALGLENRAARGGGDGGDHVAGEAVATGGPHAPGGGSGRSGPEGRRAGEAGRRAPAGVGDATAAGRRDLDRARELATAVDRAARRGLFRPRCLARALALQRLLASRGLGGARVRVGVERQSTGFSAHAWVEYRGVVLGESSQSLSSFTPLPGLDVFPRS